VKVNREVKIGLLTVATVFLFIWGLNFLKGRDIFTRQVSFYAVYEDVSGLIESNPVSLNGVIIGQVNRIRFMPDGSGRILVENIIDSRIEIPQNSISVLTASSLTGTREIIIQMGDSQQYISDGDTLSARSQPSLQDEVSQFVAPVKERTEALFNQVDSVMAVFQAIFSEETRTNIAHSFESIEQTLANLEATTEKLDTSIDKETDRISNIIANAESISQNLKNNNELLSNAIENFSNISDSVASANLKQTLLSAENNMHELGLILEKINKGEGTMGLLMNDEQLYHNLESTSRQLEVLLEDIQKNPGDYIRISVFGR